MQNNSSSNLKNKHARNEEPKLTSANNIGARKEVLKFKGAKFGHVELENEIKESEKKPYSESRIGYLGTEMEKLFGKTVGLL